MTNIPFTPSPGTTRDFRDALGRFATGVTVVTTRADFGPLGMTVNSFASVSLDPPLVLWSPSKSSRRFPAFAEAEHYAIHILSEPQSDVAHAFARRGHGFDGIDWKEGTGGTPLIAGCAARFECRQTARHDGGDHEILVGEVLRAGIGNLPPLLFLGGAYGTFHPHRAENDPGGNTRSL